MSNAERVYESLRPWLANLEKTRTVIFLGREFYADNIGIKQLSGEKIQINAKSVLIWYLTFGGDKLEPSFVFTPLHTFSNGIFTAQNSDWQSHDRKTHEKLTFEAFRTTSERLGASVIRQERYGESRLLFALPNLPVKLTFSEGDEEFPATLDIKFGTNATQILPFETLAVLQGLILREFASYI
jgi:hypothetical protein